jgi:hypothetical protein
MIPVIVARMTGQSLLSLALSKAIARFCCGLWVRSFRSVSVSGHLTFAKNVNKAKGIFLNELRQCYEVCCWIFGQGRDDWIAA